MSLNGAKFVCLDENDGRGVTIPAKGRKFTIGYYMSCDHVLSDSNAKGIHCEINSDAFGRVTIHNMSEEHPVCVNDRPIGIKRPLLNGSVIKILGKKYLWEFPKLTTNETEDLNMETSSTPIKRVGIPEQPPNSCPNLKFHRDVKKRLTIHNFAYYIQSDDEGNTSVESSESSVLQSSELESELPQSSTEGKTTTSGKMLSYAPTMEETEQEDRCVSPGSQGQSAKVINLEDTPKVNMINCTQNKENIHNTEKMKSLICCRQSDVVITSYSPRETGVRIEKSFTAILKPTTPCSMYGTSKGALLGAANDIDGSVNLIDFSTPANSKKPMNSPMHLIDFTTPGKMKLAASASLKPVQKPTKQSFGQRSVGNARLHMSGLNSLRTPIAVGEAKANETPDSVISVNSTDSYSSVVEVSDSSLSSSCSIVAAATSTVTPKKSFISKALTPRRTPTSLMKRALLTSAKKRGVTPVCTNSQKPIASSPDRRMNVGTPTSTPRKMQFVTQRYSLSTPSRRTSAASRLKLERLTSTPNDALLRTAPAKRCLYSASSEKLLSTSTPVARSSCMQRAAEKHSNLHMIRKSVAGMPLTSHISKVSKSFAMSKISDISPSTSSSAQTKSAYLPSPANARARAMAAASIQKQQLTKTPVASRKSCLVVCEKRKIPDESNDLNKTFTLDDSENEEVNTNANEGKAKDATFFPIKDVEASSQSSVKMNVTFSPEKSVVVGEAGESSEDVDLPHQSASSEVVIKRKTSEYNEIKNDCHKEHKSQRGVPVPILSNAEDISEPKNTENVAEDGPVDQENDDLLEQIEDVLHKSDELQKHLEESINTSSSTGMIDSVSKQDAAVKILAEEFEEIAVENKEEFISDLLQSCEEIKSSEQIIFSCSYKAPITENNYVDRFDQSERTERASISYSTKASTTDLSLETKNLTSEERETKRNKKTELSSICPVDTNYEETVIVTDKHAQPVSEEMSLPTTSVATKVPPKTPNLRGIKELLKTPKHRKEPTTPTLRGVRNLMRTPKQCAEVIKELDETLDGVSVLLQTPSVTTTLENDGYRCANIKNEMSVTFTPRRSARRASMSAELCNYALTPKRITRRRASISVETEVASVIKPQQENELTRKVIFEKHVADKIGSITEEKPTCSAPPTTALMIVTGNMSEQRGLIEKDLNVNTRHSQNSTPKVTESEVCAKSGIPVGLIEDSICGIVKDRNKETHFLTDQEDDHGRDSRPKIVDFSDYEYGKEINTGKEIFLTASEDNPTTSETSPQVKDDEESANLKDLLKQHEMSVPHNFGKTEELEHHFEKPSSSLEATYNLNHVQPKRLPRCSTPNTLKKGQRCFTSNLDTQEELTNTIHGTSERHVSKFLIDRGLLPRPEFLNTTNTETVDMENENLEKFFRTPRAKDMMVLTSTNSVNPKKNFDSVDITNSDDYDLNETNLENLDDLFKTSETENFGDYVNNLNDTGGATTAAVERKEEEEDTDLSEQPTSDEIFDSLAGQVSVTKTPNHKSYSRKLMSATSPSTVLRSPFSAADIITDLPKSDIQEWVDSLENVNLPEDLQETSMYAGDDVRELTHDPLALSTMQITDSNTKEITCNNMPDISVASSTLDPLSTSVLLSGEQNTATSFRRLGAVNETVSEEVNMSGIDLLAQSEDSMLSEKLMASNSSTSLDKTLEETKDNGMEANLRDEYRHLSDSPHIVINDRNATTDDSKPPRRLLCTSLEAQDVNATIDLEMEEINPDKTASDLAYQNNQTVISDLSIEELEKFGQKVVSGVESEIPIQALNEISDHGRSTDASDSLTDVCNEIVNQSLPTESGANDSSSNKKPTISKSLSQSSGSITKMNKLELAVTSEKYNSDDIIIAQPSSKGKTSNILQRSETLPVECAENRVTTETSVPTPTITKVNEATTTVSHNALDAQMSTASLEHVYAAHISSDSTLFDVNESCGKLAYDIATKPAFDQKTTDEVITVFETVSTENIINTTANENCSSYSSRNNYVSTPDIVATLESVSDKLAKDEQIVETTKELMTEHHFSTSETSDINISTKQMELATVNENVFEDDSACKDMRIKTKEEKKENNKSSETQNEETLRTKEGLLPKENIIPTDKMFLKDMQADKYDENVKYNDNAQKIETTETDTDKDTETAEVECDLAKENIESDDTRTTERMGVSEFKNTSNKSGELDYTADINEGFAVATVQYNISKIIYEKSNCMEDDENRVSTTCENIQLHSGCEESETENVERSEVGQIAISSRSEEEEKRNLKEASSLRTKSALFESSEEIENIRKDINESICVHSTAAVVGSCETKPAIHVNSDSLSVRTISPKEEPQKIEISDTFELSHSPEKPQSSEHHVVNPFEQRESSRQEKKNEDYHEESPKNSRNQDSTCSQHSTQDDDQNLVYKDVHNTGKTPISEIKGECMVEKENSVIDGTNFLSCNKLDHCDSKIVTEFDSEKCIPKPSVLILPAEVSAFNDLGTVAQYKNKEVDEQNSLVEKDTELESTLGRVAQYKNKKEVNEQFSSVEKNTQLESTFMSEKLPISQVQRVMEPVSGDPHKISEKSNLKELVTEPKQVEEKNKTEQKMVRTLRRGRKKNATPIELPKVTKSDKEGKEYHKKAETHEAIDVEADEVKRNENEVTNIGHKMNATPEVGKIGGDETNFVNFTSHKLVTKEIKGEPNLNELITRTEQNEEENKMVRGSRRRNAKLIKFPEITKVNDGDGKEYNKKVEIDDETMNIQPVCQKEIRSRRVGRKRNPSPVEIPIAKVTKVGYDEEKYHTIAEAGDKVMDAKPEDEVNEEAVTVEKKDKEKLTRAKRVVKKVNYDEFKESQKIVKKVSTRKGGRRANIDESHDESKEAREEAVVVENKDEEKLIKTKRVVKKVNYDESKEPQEIVEKVLTRRGGRRANIDESHDESKEACEEAVAVEKKYEEKVMKAKRVVKKVNYDESREPQEIVEKVSTRRGGRRANIDESHDESKEINSKKLPDHNKMNEMKFRTTRNKRQRLTSQNHSDPEESVTAPTLNKNKSDDKTTHLHDDKDKIILPQSADEGTFERGPENAINSTEKVIILNSVLTVSPEPKVLQIYDEKDTADQEMLTDVDSQSATHGIPTIDPLKSSRGRTRKPTARAQQFLEEERAKASTPKRRRFLMTAQSNSATPQTPVSVATESLASIGTPKTSKRVHGQKVGNNDGSHTQLEQHETEESSGSKEGETKEFNAAVETEEDDRPLNYLLTPQHREAAVYSSTPQSAKRSSSRRQKDVLSVPATKQMATRARSRKVRIEEAGDDEDDEPLKKKPTQNETLDLVTKEPTKKVVTRQGRILPETIIEEDNQHIGEVVHEVEEEKPKITRSRRRVGNNKTSQSDETGKQTTTSVSTVEEHTDDKAAAVEEQKKAKPMRVRTGRGRTIKLDTEDPLSQQQIAAFTSTIEVTADEDANNEPEEFEDESEKPSTSAAAAKRNAAKSTVSSPASKRSRRKPVVQAENSEVSTKTRGIQKRRVTFESPVAVNLAVTGEKTKRATRSTRKK